MPPPRPDPLSPEALRAEADALEKDAEARLDQVRADRARVKLLRDMARQLEGLGKSSGLTLHPDSTNIGQMSSAISSPNFARGVSRSKHRNHPWLKAMYSHADPDKRMTVTAWAQAHGKAPGTVASWLSKRRIPLSVAKTIEEEYGVKATLKNWPQGISAD